MGEVKTCQGCLSLKATSFLLIAVFMTFMNTSCLRIAPLPSISKKENHKSWKLREIERKNFIDGKVSSIERIKEKEKESDKKEPVAPAEPLHKRIIKFLLSWIGIIILVVVLMVIFLGSGTTFFFLKKGRDLSQRAVKGLSEVMDKLINEDNGIDGKIIKDTISKTIDSADRDHINKIRKGKK